MPGNDAIDYINRDIVNVKNELQVLSKIVRDGNGQPSLIQQVSSISNRLENMETTVTHNIAELKASFDSAQKAAAEKSSVSWQVKVAIFVAILSSATSIYISWQDKAGNASDNKESIRTLEKKIDTLIQQKVTLKGTAQEDQADITVSVPKK